MCVTDACVSHTHTHAGRVCYYCSRVPLSFVLYLNIGITILSYKKYTQCGCRLIHSKTGATRSRSISRHVVFIVASAPRDESRRPHRCGKIETSAKVASRFWHVMGTSPLPLCGGQRAARAGPLAGAARRFWDAARPTWALRAQILPT